MVRKIFLNSTFRDSGTHANFQTTLKTPVSHPKCRAYLDQIRIPHTMHTIHEHNKHLYVVEQWTTTNPTAGHTRKRKIILDEGNYDISTLATELQSKLNTNTFLPGGPSSYTVTPLSKKERITIAIAGTNTPQLAIWPMAYLKAHTDLWVDSHSNQVGTFVPDDDAYTALGFTQDTIVNVLPNSPQTGIAHVSMIPFHTLYLTCAFGLGTNEDAIGPKGGNLLRSIGVNAPPGGIIHDQLQNAFDYVALEAGVLHTFSFALKDLHDRDIPLFHGFSFTILLVEEE